MQPDKNIGSVGVPLSADAAPRNVEREEALQHLKKVADSYESDDNEKALCALLRFVLCKAEDDKAMTLIEDLMHSKGNELHNLTQVSDPKSLLEELQIQIKAGNTISTIEAGALKKLKNLCK